MKIEDFLQTFLHDVKTELHANFDRNFERKAFFTQKWPSNKIANRKGSPLMRTGALRRSINSKVQGMDIVFTSSLPYADIQNEGGEIVVTEKMKKLFWAMYYKNAGAVQTTKVKGNVSNSQRNIRLTQEAQKWKALALQPVGKIMKIEKRQFIGDHPITRGLIKRTFYRNAEELKQIILDMHNERNN